MHRAQFTMKVIFSELMLQKNDNLQSGANLCPRLTKVAKPLKNIIIDFS